VNMSDRCDTVRGRQEDAGGGYDLFTTFKAPQITRIIIIIIIILIILKNEYHSNIIVDRLQGCGAVYL